MDKSPRVPQGDTSGITSFSPRSMPDSGHTKRIEVSMDRNSKEVSNSQDRCWDREMSWGVSSAWGVWSPKNGDEGIGQLNGYLEFEMERGNGMVRREFRMW